MAGISLFRKPNCDCPCGGMVRPGGDGSLPMSKNRMGERARPDDKRKTYYKKHRMDESNKLKEAKKEAANIVEKANNRSSQILNDAKVKAEKIQQLINHYKDK